MRYPLCAFMFVFVLGPFAAHALLTGTARIEPHRAEQRQAWSNTHTVWSKPPSHVAIQTAYRISYRD